MSITPGTLWDGLKTTLEILIDFNWIPFVIGFGILVGLATLTRAFITQALQNRMDHDHVIPLKGRFLYFVDFTFPFMILHTCVWISFILLMVNHNACGLLSSLDPSQSPFSSAGQCQIVLQDTTSVVLGGGVGLATWLYLWTIRFNRTTSTPVRIAYDQTLKYGWEIRTFLTGIVVIALFLLVRHLSFIYVSMLQ